MQRAYHERCPTAEVYRLHVDDSESCFYWAVWCETLSSPAIAWLNKPQAEERREKHPGKLASLQTSHHFSDHLDTPPKVKDEHRAFFVVRKSYSRPLHHWSHDIFQDQLPACPRNLDAGTDEMGASALLAMSCRQVGQLTVPTAVPRTSAS